MRFRTRHADVQTNGVTHVVTGIRRVRWLSRPAVVGADLGRQRAVGNSGAWFTARIHARGPRAGDRQD
jgi:hypothetical protein